MFVLLEGKIFVKEEIKKVFLRDGNCMISYKEEIDNNCSILTTEILRVNATLENIRNIFDILTGGGEGKKGGGEGKKIPNSKKCLNLKTEQETLGIYKRCSVAANKLCSEIFGSSICCSLYEEKREDE